MLKQAETLEQFRAAQSILLPALLGATIEQTAEVLGVSTASVSRLRARFKTTPVSWGERRGGRRNALMSLEEEEQF
jgi:transposase